MLDVTNYEDVSAATQKVLDTYGRIDSLVLNAGKSQRALAEQTTVESTRELLELNFISYVALTKLVLPVFIGQHSGQVSSAAEADMVSWFNFAL